MNCFQCILAGRMIFQLVTIMLTLLLLLQVLFTLSNANLLTGSGMQPANPIIEEGKSLKLNCTLDDILSQNFTAEDIYFKFGNTLIDRQYYNVVNNKTAEMIKPNITKMNTHVFCYVGQNIKVGQQNVVVGRKPLQPNITGCVVDNWTSMTCHWEPSKEEQEKYTGLVTNQSLHWTLLNKYMYFLCLHYDVHRNSCRFMRYSEHEGDSFQFGQIYFLQVEAKNRLGHAYSEKEHAKAIDTTLLVKPSHVSGLEATNVESHEMKLTWRAPSEGHKILYKLSYKSKWDKEEKVVNVTTTEAKLENLVPYSTYHISVTCIPIVKDMAAGYWSEKRVKNITTDTDVPGGLPTLSPGAFSINSQGDVENWTIQLYWKPVEERLRNGEIVNNYLTITEEDGHTWPERPVRGSDSNITLNKYYRYTIKITAATNKGRNNSLLSTPIHIPAFRELPPKCDDFVVIAANESSFDFNWTAVDGASGYMLYWCNGHPQDMKCLENSPINWVELGANKTHTSLNLYPQTKNQLLFAISVIKFIEDGVPVSSGMKFSPCSYSKFYEIDKPIGQPVKQDAAGNMELSWDMPPCRKTGYIKYVIIYYCQTKDCDGTTKVEKVLAYKTPHIYTLKGLDAETEYKLWMTSEGADGTESTATMEETFTPPHLGLKNGHIAGIIVGCILMLVFIVFGVKYCFKNTKKKFDEYRTINIQNIQMSHGAIIDQDPSNEQDQTDFYVLDTPYQIQCSSRHNDENFENNVLEENDGKPFHANGIGGRSLPAHKSAPVSAVVHPNPVNSHDPNIENMSSGETFMTTLPPENGAASPDVFSGAHSPVTEDRAVDSVGRNSDIGPYSQLAMDGTDRVGEGKQEGSHNSRLLSELAEGLNNITHSQDMVVGHVTHPNLPNNRKAHHTSKPDSEIAVNNLTKVPMTNRNNANNNRDLNHEGVPCRENNESADLAYTKVALQDPETSSVHSNSSTKSLSQSPAGTNISPYVETAFTNPQPSASNENNVVMPTNQNGSANALVPNPSFDPGYVFEPPSRITVSPNFAGDNESLHKSLKEPVPQPNGYVTEAAMADMVATSPRSNLKASPLAQAQNDIGYVTEPPVVRSQSPQNQEMNSSKSISSPLTAATDGYSQGPVLSHAEGRTLAEPHHQADMQSSLEYVTEDDIAALNKKPVDQRQLSSNSSSVDKLGTDPAGTVAPEVVVLPIQSESSTDPEVLMASEIPKHSSYSSPLNKNGYVSHNSPIISSVPSVSIKS